MAELILYACPVGALAHAIEAYWDAVRTSVGPNAAHDYMPHVTLTGFFRDDESTIGRHLEVLRRLLAASPPPTVAIAVTGVLCAPSHHLLTVESAWCRAVTADFAAETPGVRVKDRLHVSLAYGFDQSDGTALERLGRAMVDPSLPAAWELRFYERVAPAQWRLHGAWTLQPPAAIDMDGSG